MPRGDPPDPSLPRIQPASFGIYYWFNKPLTVAEYLRICRAFRARYPGIQHWLTRDTPPMLAVQLSVALDAEQRDDYRRAWNSIVLGVRPNAKRYSPGASNEIQDLS
jgi:hypothetical protein